MFGWLAVYVKDKIVPILRDKPTSVSDNGLWLAATAEHDQSAATSWAPGFHAA